MSLAERSSCSHLETIYVTDEIDVERQPLAFPYTKGVLKSTLQLMGCKPRYAYKATDHVFAQLEEHADCFKQETSCNNAYNVTVPRETFLNMLRASLTTAGVEPVQQEDLAVACSIRERRSCVVVLLCGTSGTGKSTLASLVAQRLGITTVVSTDSIRHMLRSFVTADENPLLWVSTYQAGDHLKANGGNWEGVKDSRQLAVKGYKAQSEMVIESLERLISSCEARKESLVVEGVHLSLNFVVGLMAHHPSIVPFLIHISNEAKHRERFAVRAKYMTLEPSGNRYIQHIKNIRSIQEYLVKRADKHCIPKVDNTNVDRSVATIHATVLGCLKRRAKGEVLLDSSSMTCPAVLSEYLQCKSATWSSKDMLEIIRRKKHAFPVSLSDRPSSSSTPQGPLSDFDDELGDDGKSFYGMDDGDLVSSSDADEHGAGEQGDSSTDEEGSRGALSGEATDDEGSVNEGDADDDDA